MIKLSQRLKYIASFVDEGSVLADVGCDHGLLSLRLLKEGKADHAFLVDINPGPLARAAENAECYGLTDRVDIILSDGLKALPEYIREKGTGLFPDTVLISGMGGKLIEDIIADTPESVRKNIKSWILSPQSEISELRRDLGLFGLNIKDDGVVKDQGKYYFVIKAEAFAGDLRPDTNSGNFKDVELKYGRYSLLRKDPCLKELIEKDMAGIEALLENAELPDNRRGELLSELDGLKGAYSGFKMP